MKPKVLLLNPPSTKPVSRDGFLGVETDPALVLPPSDLAALSGILKEGAELEVLDAVAEGLNPKKARARAVAAKPDAVVFLASGLTYTEDSPFLTDLDAALPKARFAGLGDIYRDAGEMAFALQPFLDAVLLDSTTGAAASWLAGAAGPIDGVIYRKGDDIIRGRERRVSGWSLPAPRWDLFPLKSYRSPLAPKGPCASLTTDFGCPYLCAYCPSSTLGHKFRPVGEVVAEAAALKKLGVKTLAIRDQTFGFHRARTEELLEGLKPLGLTWSCTTRVDLADAALFKLMKRAGCAAVSFGIDSGDDEILRAFKKSTTGRQAERAVALAKAAGLKSWGVFVVGLSLDTRQSVETTIAFARSLALDRLSFQIESQRHCTDYRRDMLVRGLVPTEAMPPDTPTTVSVWQGRLGLSNTDAQRFLTLASGGHALDAR